jgi:hypothetical protein
MFPETREKCNKDRFPAEPQFGCLFIPLPLQCTYAFARKRVLRNSADSRRIRGYHEIQIQVPRSLLLHSGALHGRGVHGQSPRNHLQRPHLHREDRRLRGLAGREARRIRGHPLQQERELVEYGAMRTIPRPPGRATGSGSSSSPTATARPRSGSSPSTAAKRRRSPTSRPACRISHCRAMVARSP